MPKSCPRVRSLNGTVAVPSSSGVPAGTEIEAYVTPFSLTSTGAAASWSFEKANWPEAPVPERPRE